MRLTAHRDCSASVRIYWVADAPRFQTPPAFSSGPIWSPGLLKLLHVGGGRQPAQCSFRSLLVVFAPPVFNLGSGCRKLLPLNGIRGRRELAQVMVSDLLPN